MAGLAFWAANQTLLATDHIDLSQVSPNAVTATANQPVRNWNHVFGSSSMTDCTRASYSSSNDQVSAAQTRTITWTTGSRRNGNNLCVRTLVDTSEREYAYSSPLRIDLAGPTIRFESGRSAADSIQATVNDYNNLHDQASASSEIAAAEVISGASFRYAILRGSSDCSVRNLNLRTINTDLTRTSTTADNFNELMVNIPVSADDHRQYVCLKTTDQYGNASYQSSARLDTEIERVSLRVNNNQVRMTAGEILTSVWAEATSDTCNYDNLAQQTANAQGVTSLSVSYNDNDTIVCFHLTDRQANSASYSYTLDTNPPSDPVANQSGRIVIATTTDDDQRDNPGDNDYPKDWGIKSWHSYFVDSASTDLATTLDEACDADSYGKSGTDSNDQTWRVYSTRSSRSRIVLSSSHSRYEAICFRATDYSGSNSYGNLELGDFESSDPVINGQRSNYSKEVTLTLSSTSKRATTWRWVAMEINQTCGINLITGTTAPTSSNKIEVEDANIGGLFCVEVLLNNNDRIYQIVETGSSQIDNTAPEISAAWERNSLRATATDDLSGVKSTSWQWQIITNPDHAADSCQPDDDADPKITSWRRGSNTGSLGTSRNGQFVCFRVSDNVGNTGYSHFEIEVVSLSTDTSRPAVNVRRNGKTVTATSTASDLPSVPDWRYVISNSSDCNKGVFDSAGSSLGYGSSVQLVDGDDVWVCFQVTDSSGNDGHDNIRVDLAGPTIVVSRSGSRVTATANETASQWIYFRSDDHPDYCVADSEWNFNKHQTFVGRTVSGLTSADVGKYLCFRAKDSHGNHGVAPYQISGPIGQPVQTSRLTISFAQGPTQLVASANRAVSSWRYLVYESAPSNCDKDNTYFDSDFAGNSNKVDLDANDNGRYYCFEANASDGSQAYSDHRVNIATSPSTGQTTPQPIDVLTVSVDQEDNKLTASANRAISTWRYLIYATKPANCNDKNSYFAANNGRIGRGNVIDLVVEDSDRYYCFEAADANDRKAYYLHQVETVVVTPEPEEVTTPEPEATTTTPETIPEPVVTVDVVRKNNQLVATADKRIANWRYLIYSNQPTCDDSNTYFDKGAANLVGRTSTVDLSEFSVGRYYCFRAKTRAGQTGYYIHRVTRPVANPIVEETPKPEETKPPATPKKIKISASRDGLYLVAKANQPIAQWRYLIYTTKPNCNGNNVYFDQSGSKVGRSNKATWITTDSDRYYCFRAKTADGRTAFALYRIPATMTVAEPVSPETPAPVVTVQTPAPEPEQGQEPGATTATTQPPTTAVVNITTTQPPAATNNEQQPVEQTEDKTDETSLPVDQTTPAQTTTDITTNDPPVDDDDLPWPWIIGGVGAAILIVLLVFRPRRKFDDDETDNHDHDLSV